MKTYVWMIGLVALLVAIAGCTKQAPAQGAMEKDAAAMGMTPEENQQMLESMEKDKMMEGEWTPEEIAAMEKGHGATMMGGAYRDWDAAAFDQAVRDQKIILIDFAADWCGICQKEHPQLMAGFEQLNDPRFVGFRVHYKDSLTTPEHDALAQQYQIPYQHTKVVLKDGKVVLKSPEAWTAERLVTELRKLA
jgi:thiol-disulfide isomerase/thioredoxin